MTPHDEKELEKFITDIGPTQEQIDLIATFIKKNVPDSTDLLSAMRYLKLTKMQVNSAIILDWPEDAS